jgi:hypothetical protein
MIQPDHAPAMCPPASMTPGGAPANRLWGRLDLRHGHAIPTGLLARWPVGSFWVGRLTWGSVPVVEGPTNGVRRRIGWTGFADVAHTGSGGHRARRRVGLQRCGSPGGAGQRCPGSPASSARARCRPTRILGLGRAQGDAAGLGRNAGSRRQLSAQRGLACCQPGDRHGRSRRPAVGMTPATQ